MLGLAWEKNVLRVGTGRVRRNAVGAVGGRARGADAHWVVRVVRVAYLRLASGGSEGFGSVCPEKRFFGSQKMRFPMRQKFQ